MKTRIYRLVAGATLSLCLVAAVHADGPEDCWIEMQRTMLGTLKESGSFLHYDGEGNLDRAAYHNETIRRSEPSPGVFVVQWNFQEFSHSGSTRLNIRERTIETESFAPEVIELDMLECTKVDDGLYKAALRFTGSSGGATYDVEEAQLVMGHGLHVVRSVRPAGTDELFGPIEVYFAAKQPE
jgi:hypothetical protein